MLYILHVGQAVFDQSGELVVTKPFPSMPVFFWNDKDNTKYRKAYFSNFSGKFELVFIYVEHHVVSTTFCCQTYLDY